MKFLLLSVFCLFGMSSEVKAAAICDGPIFQHTYNEHRKGCQADGFDGEKSCFVTDYMCRLKDGNLQQISRVDEGCLPECFTRVRTE